MKPRTVASWGALAVGITIAHTARAQDSYEIEVYNSLIAPTRTVMFEVHGNYTIDGQYIPVQSGGVPPPIDDAIRAAPGAAGSCQSTVHYSLVPATRAFASSPRATARACTNNAETSHVGRTTIEATTGVASWAEVAVYAFSSEQRRADAPAARYDGTSVRSKIHVPDSWSWPVGLALSAELEHDPPSVSADSWSWELRPVIDKSAGRWYASINPTLVRTLHGPGVANGVELSPSAKVAFDFTQLVSAGIEYYGADGRIDHFAPPSERIQQFFAAADLHISPQWEINMGAGIAATPATNHLVVKLLVGRSVSWARPEVP